MNWEPRDLSSRSNLAGNMLCEFRYILFPSNFLVSHAEKDKGARSTLTHSTFLVIQYIKSPFTQVILSEKLLCADIVLHDGEAVKKSEETKS